MREFIQRPVHFSETAYPSTPYAANPVADPSVSM